MIERLSPLVSLSHGESSPCAGRSRLFRRPVALALLVLLVSACGAHSGVVRSARDGDEKALSRALHEAQSAGKLSRCLAEDVAQSLLEGEIERSRNKEGEDFIASLSLCGRELESALARRSRTHDEVGGRALLLLVESGRRHGDALDHERDEIVSYRAAFARALTGPKNASRRVPLYSDPDVLVRRAALDAAQGSTTAEEFDALADAARHDPDPLCRSKAIRLLGNIDAPSSVPMLLERYGSGSEQEKLAALEGLRRKAVSDLGARDELYHLATGSEGLLRLSAAIVVLEGALPLEPEQKEFLTNIIDQAARSGAPSERVVAFRFLDLDSQATRELLREATGSPSESVQLAALSYLIQEGQEKEDRAHAEELLLELAQKNTGGAARAKQILASQSFHSVRSLLLEDIKSKDPEVRVAAAEGLIALDLWDQAGVLLADPEPTVRRRLACTMLAAGDSPPPRDPAESP